MSWLDWSQRLRGSSPARPVRAARPAAVSRRTEASRPAPVRPERERDDWTARSGVSLPAADVLPSRALLGQRLGNLKRELHEPDYVVLVSIVALAAVGILMVYSASAIPAYAQSDNTFDFVAPQIVWCLIGLVTMLVLMRLDYRLLRVVSVPVFIAAVVLLLLVLVPAVGVTRNESTRWLHLGPLPEFHPAEFAKLAMIVYLAHWLATRGTNVRSFTRGLVPFAVLTAPLVVLVAREPDLGTASVIAFTALVLFFVAGANLFHLAMIVAGGAGAGVMLLLAAGQDRIQRILTLLDPWSDPLGSGYHTIKALEAIGIGGPFGIGLGQDRVAVPNDFNDFIFAVIAEQLGLVGGVVVIGLFLAFGYAGIRTALRAPDTFGGLLAAGITTWISLQALINIAVVLAIVPVTGITLPFVSDGGSSLLISFAAVGILLSISRETVERGSWNASADRGRGYGRTYLPGSGRREVAARSTDRG